MKPARQPKESRKLALDQIRDESLLSVREAAMIMRVNEQFVRGLIRDGLIQYLPVGDRKEPRIILPWIRDFYASQEARAAAEIQAGQLLDGPVRPRRSKIIPMHR